MLTLSDMDRKAFKNGVAMTFAGLIHFPFPPFGVGKDESYGVAYASRIIRSLQPDWSIGERIAVTSDEVTSQLKSVRDGDLSLLPSPAEAAARFVNAGFPPPAIVDDLSRIRPDRDAFDREAAAYILSVVG
jgi:hypothetical protein